MTVDLLINELIEKGNMQKNYFSPPEAKKKGPLYESPSKFLEYMKLNMISPILDKKYSGNPNDLKIDNSKVLEDINYKMMMNYGIHDKRPYAIKGPLIIK